MDMMCRAPHTPVFSRYLGPENREGEYIQTMIR
jgi:hypothetical protein